MATPHIPPKSFEYTFHSYPHPVRVQSQCWSAAFRFSRQESGVGIIARGGQLASTSVSQCACERRGEDHGVLPEAIAS